MSRKRKNTTPNYLPWVALIALGVMVGLWAIDEVPSNVSPTPETAEPKQPSTKAQANIEEPKQSKPLPAGQLVWSVASSPELSAQELASCLMEIGLRNVSTVGHRGRPIIVTQSGLDAPQVVRKVQSITHVTTPMSRNIHGAIGLHVATTQCLYQPGAAVDDKALGRQLMGIQWPQLGEEGQVSIEDVLQIIPSANALTTKGLQRLGKTELVYSGGTDQKARRLLLKIAAHFIVAPNTSSNLMVTGVGEVRLEIPKGVNSDQLDFLIARITSPLPQPKTPNKIKPPPAVPVKTKPVVIPNRSPKVRSPRRPTKRKASKKAGKSRSPFRPDYR